MTNEPGKAYPAFDGDAYWKIQVYQSNIFFFNNCINKSIFAILLFFIILCFLLLKLESYVLQDCSFFIER